MPLYHLQVFKQTILQSCLCLGGLFKTNKQKLMGCGLLPNQLWEMLVSMGARNTQPCPPPPTKPGEKKEMVGGRVSPPDLDFLLLDETGKT